MMIVIGLGAQVLSLPIFQSNMWIIEVVLPFLFHPSSTQDDVSAAYTCAGSIQPQGSMHLVL